MWIYQDYDGNGVRAKRVEQTQYNQGPYAFKTSYYLRSSVLNGKVITELNELGQRRETNIYANGTSLVQQKDNQVYWVHVDPITQSTRETQTDGAIAQRFEFDPLGNDIPLSDPLPQEMPPDYEFTGNYGSSGNPYDGPSGCMVDGFPMPCNLMWGMANFGRPANLSGGTLGGLVDSGVWVDEWESYDDGTPTTFDQNNNPIVQSLASRSVGRFAIIPAGGRIATSVNAQKPLPLPSNLGERVANVANNPKSKCAEFIKNLIAEAAKTGRAYSDNPAALFNRVKGIKLRQIRDSGEAGIIGKKRVIYIDPVTTSNDPRSIDHSENAYAVTVLNELMHHAKRSGLYTDTTLAEAIFPLLTEQERRDNPLPRSQDNDVNSRYWHPLFKKRCPSTTGE